MTHGFRPKRVVCMWIRVMMMIVAMAMIIMVMTMVAMMVMPMRMTGKVAKMATMRHGRP